MLCTIYFIYLLIFYIIFIYYKPQEVLNLLINKGALLRTLLHVTVYVFAQFAENPGTDCK
jgi:hypothetical protein